MAMLLLVKLVVSVVVIAADATLSTISRWLFSPLKKYPALELTIVMIVCPYILNGIQFWLIDELLMSSKPAPQQQGSNSSSGTTLPKSKYGHLSHDDDSNSSAVKAAKRRLDDKHIIREPSWVNPKAGHSSSAIASDSSSVGTPNFSSMRGNSIDSNDDSMPQYANQELV
jgi:STIMATE family